MVTLDGEFVVGTVSGRRHMRVFSTKILYVEAHSDFVPLQTCTAIAFLASSLGLVRAMLLQGCSMNGGPHRAHD